jgi:hypothetical protein
MRVNSSCTLCVSRYSFSSRDVSLSSILSRLALTGARARERERSADLPPRQTATPDRARARARGPARRAPSPARPLAFHSALNDQIKREREAFLFYFFYALETTVALTVYLLLAKQLRDSGLPADVLLGKLNKDISFALRRGTIAQVTTHDALDAAQRAVEYESALNNEAEWDR